MKLTAERLRYLIELENNADFVNIIQVYDGELLSRLIKSYREIQAQIYSLSDYSVNRDMNQ